MSHKLTVLELLIGLGLIFSLQAQVTLPNGVTVPKDHFIVFLMGGCCDMSGRTSDGDMTPDPNCWAWGTGTRNQNTQAWVPLKDKIFNNSQGAGPAVPMMEILAQRYPGYYFGVVQFSNSYAGLRVNATGNAFYKPGCKWYDRLISNAKTLQSKVTIGGLYTMLGVAECEYSSTSVSPYQLSYATDYKMMVDSMRKDLGLTPERFPVFLMEQEHDSFNELLITKAGPAETWKQQLMVPTILASAATVSTIGVPIAQSTHHYNHPQFTTIATRWADTLKLKGFDFWAKTVPLTVSITSPANGATFTAPASITIKATASSVGGSVSNVEFFQGTNKLGESTTAPYSLTWSGVAAGSYSLTAKATDNGDATATSETVNVTVNTSGGTNVSILGSWVVGTTHAKETGTDCALVVFVYGEHSSSAMSINSITYGGQTMTPVVVKNQGTVGVSYSGAFILNQNGIAAATSGTIAVNWATAPSNGSSVVSVFLSNVNQAVLTGATASAGSNGAVTVSTSALATAPGDMALVGATAGSNGSNYAVNNGFTKGPAEQSPSWGDIVAGYKAATGASETPSVTMPSSQRQVIVGFVLKSAGSSTTQHTITASAGSNGSISPSGDVLVNSGSSQTFTITANSGYQVDVVTVDGASQGAIASYTFNNVTDSHSISATFKPVSSGGDVSILGSWVVGTTHAKETGTDRALVVFVYGEHSNSAMSINSVTYGGQTMTPVVVKNQGTVGVSYSGAFILNESSVVVAATSGTIAVNWATAPSNGSSVVSVFLSNVNQAALTGATASAGSNSAVTVSTSPLATAAGDMVLLGATAGTNGTNYAVNNGFTKGHSEQAPSWGDIVAGYKSATGVAETPTVTVPTITRQSIVGLVVRSTALGKIGYEADPEIPQPVTYALKVSSISKGKITFTLPDAGNYSISVYSMAGARVINRSNGSGIAGLNTISVNQSLLSNQPYVINLRFGKNVSVQKMMLQSK